MAWADEHPTGCEGTPSFRRNPERRTVADPPFVAICSERPRAHRYLDEVGAAER